MGCGAGAPGPSLAADGVEHGHHPAREPASAPGVFDREHATGDWGGARKSLAERGVGFDLIYTGEVMALVDGGLDRGADYQGLLQGRVAIELEKLVGLPGARLHAHALSIHGEGVSGDHVGDLNNVSSIDAADRTRIYELWGEQSWADGDCSLRLGILAADTEFLAYDHMALLVNATFGMPLVVSANMPAPIYPLGGTGARLLLSHGSWFVQAAIFEGDVGSERHNDSGLEVEWRREEGVLETIEAGWGEICVGLFYHTAKFTKLRTGGNVKGNAVVYGAFDLLVYEEGDGTDEQGLNFFFRAGWAPRDRNRVEWQVDAGFHYLGLFPGRDEDTFVVAGAWTKIGDPFDRADPAARYDYEAVAEASYDIAIAPWLHVQPDVQYIVHPGGSSAIDDALVIGLRGTIAF